jgi:hypothetical protein
MVNKPSTVHIWDEETGGSLCGQIAPALVHAHAIDAELIPLICNKCLEKAITGEHDENYGCDLVGLIFHSSVANSGPIV